MRRIFPAFAYGPGPRSGCWWDETAPLPPAPALRGARRADVAIVGGGFTGLNAALRLADAGASVIVLEAETPGWGASGRNGGFCCLGGAKLGDAALDRSLGKQERLRWRRTEVAAVEHVAGFLERTGTDADTHSDGETWLAHRPRAMRGIEAELEAIRENYGVSAILHPPETLRQAGMAGPFHGGVTIPVGFGLNPRKYLRGLLETALSAGISVSGNSPVSGIARAGRAWTVSTAQATVTAEAVIIATNGYSSDDLPGWLAARYMPVQSTVLVTRPLTETERRAQGWTSRQMAYDSRNLLHYFRLLPDDRMLFGMRGGLGASPASEARARARVARDFRRIFPAWSGVEITHSWSGMVCLSAGYRPYVGPVPGESGLYAALGYHGNGVAMGSYAGAAVGDLAAGGDPEALPRVMTLPPGRFPLGPARRLIMPPVYAGFALRDL